MKNLKKYARDIGLSVRSEKEGFSAGRDRIWCHVGKKKDKYVVVIGTIANYADTEEEVKELLRLFILGLPENWEMN